MNNKQIVKLLEDDGYIIQIKNNILLITRRDFSFAVMISYGLSQALYRVYQSIYKEINK